MIINKDKFKIYLWIVAAIYLLVLLAISSNFNTPWMWFDEAGQFYISKGLNHDAAPYEPSRGLGSVWENNRYSNLDPGGFSVLLFFWIKISNDIIWVRLLPFLFFVATVLSFIYLSYLWTKKFEVAVIMGFIPIFASVILAMAFEVRAYSMEILGTTLGFVALEKLRQNLNIKHLFLWGCVLSFFLLSRYAEIVIVFFVSLAVLYLINSSGWMIKKKIRGTAAYALPLIIVLSAIYLFSFQYHNSGKPLSYLPYIGLNPEILLQKNNLIYLMILVLLIVLLLLKKRFSLIRNYQAFIVIALAVNITFFVLSVLNKHPWCAYYTWRHHINSTRCVSMYLLTILLCVALLGEALKFLFSKSAKIKYLAIAFVALFLFVDEENLHLRISDNNSLAKLQKVDPGNFDHIYVSRHESPGIRYAFEYTDLNTTLNNIYPQQFTFLKYKDKLSLKETGTTTGIRMKDFYQKNNLFIGINPSKYNSEFNWVLLEGTRNFYVLE